MSYECNKVSAECTGRVVREYLSYCHMFLQKRHKFCLSDRVCCSVSIVVCRI
jgi:hypothetical protein